MQINVSTLYQVFNPTPLSGAEQQDRYVELGELRGESRALPPFARNLAQHIRLADRPTSQLVTGHRGSGKSTELHRLQHELGQGGDRYFVVYCDVDQTLNRADIDFTDLLLVVVRDLAQQAKDKLGIVLRSNYFQDRFAELREFFDADVDFTQIEITRGLLKLVGSLRSSGVNRKKIRDAMEPKVDSLIDAANNVIHDAKNELGAIGFKGLVITVDNLDHLVRASGENFPGENLFIRRAPEMLRLDCHMVYTAPLALVFSSQEQELQRLYDHMPAIVGLTKLQTRDFQPYEPGYAGLREVVRRRLVFASANERDVFAGDEVREQLIRLSGGQLTVLCMLVRSAIVAGLPIKMETLAELEKQERRAFARWLKVEHWRIIEIVRSGVQPERSNENETILRDLIEGLALLYHINDTEWWAVNPLVGAAPAGISPVTTGPTSAAATPAAAAVTHPRGPAPHGP